MLSHVPRAVILYVDHASVLGGGQRSLLMLLRHLDAQHFVPILACTEGRLAAEARHIDVPVETMDLGKLRGNLNLASVTGSLVRNVRHLVQAIHRNRVDVVHTNTMRASIYGALAARLTGKVLVWHVRDIYGERWYIRLMSHLADRAIAVSTAAARPLPGSRVTVIHNAIDLEEFDPTLIGGSVLRKELGVPSDTLLVGIVGRVRPWKGQRSFLEAASQVAERVPGTLFLVVGDTIFPAKEDYLGALKQIAHQQGIADRVVFTGHRSDPAEVMGALDVLVHCSEAEPFGRVLIEAMAMGKPVVAFADGGVPEIAVDGQTGLLVPPGDVSALATAIEHLLQDEPRRRAMGRKGRNRVEAMFTAEQMTRKVEKVYEELLSPRTAGKQQEPQ